MTIAFCTLLFLVIVMPALTYRIGHGHGHMVTFEEWLPRVAHAREAHMRDLARIARIALAQGDLAAFDETQRSLALIPVDFRIKQPLRS